MLRIAGFVLAAVMASAPQVPRDRAVAPEAVGTAVISGRVTILDVNGVAQPVRRARVTLEADTLTTPPRVDTDTEGRYRFEKLAAGTYRIRAEKAGFVPQVRDPRRAFERPVAFEVTAGQRLTFDLPMVRGGALDGRIIKDNGDPAVNVMVSALRFSYDANGRRATAAGLARTDDRGRFRVHSLPAGEYFLEATTDPLDVLRQAPPVPGQALTMLARAFYPGAPRIEGGQSIPVRTGQDVTGLDFSVPTVPATAVRGTVLDSTGAPAKNWFARVQRVFGPVGEVRGALNPGSNDFTYPSVPSGEFWVMGIARPSPTADLEFAVTRLTVGGEPVPALVLATAKGAVVNGRVEVEGSAAPLLNSLQVVTHETEFELPSLPDAPTGSSLGSVAPDGTFAFKSLFGPRLFRLQRLPPGWTLKSVSLDGTDVTDVPVDFRGQEMPRTVRMVITSRTGAVSGIVRDDAGQAVGRARVVVFSADDRTWGWRSRMVKSAETDDQGRYAIDGLLDGKYLVVAVPFLQDGSWMDATILGRLMPSASTLTVTGAAKLTTNLVVKP
jgi:hypothetical protein